MGLFWPRPGNPATYVTFATLPEWRRFIGEFDLNPAIPNTVLQKYNRAQKLYYLGWIDDDCIKAGEIAAFVALELALIARYGNEAERSRKNRPPDLRPLIVHMVEKDGLTDQQLPIFHKYGFTVIPNLYESDVSRGGRRETRVVLPMNLIEQRNRAVHGDPFDNVAWAGLIEVVRDLIEYAYRHSIHERVCSVAG